MIVDIMNQDIFFTTGLKSSIKPVLFITAYINGRSSHMKIPVETCTRAHSRGIFLSRNAFNNHLMSLSTLEDLAHIINVNNNIINKIQSVLDELCLTKLGYGTKEMSLNIKIKFFIDTYLVEVRIIPMLEDSFQDYSFIDMMLTWYKTIVFLKYRTNYPWKCNDCSTDEFPEGLLFFDAKLMCVEVTVYCTVCGKKVNVRHQHLVY